MQRIDFSIANAGELGKNDHFWFSDLYRTAVRGQFTGGLRISGNGERAIFFEGGRPVHASGTGFQGSHLGEILLGEKRVEPSVVTGIIQRQKSQSPRPLLGAMLVKEARLDPAIVERAIETQTRERLTELFAISEGGWESAPGADARIFQIGVPIEPLPMLFRGLLCASDRELRATSDMLLGKAVSLTKDPPSLLSFAFDEAARKVLKYLEKPRKPDQLERAAGNRRLVRALLRLLQMEDALKLDPAAKAIPIPKATSLGVAGTASILGPRPQEVKTIVPPPRKASTEPPPATKDLKEFHASMKTKSHFELFGVSQTSAIDPIALRKNFTVMAKKYHPDAFAHAVSEEIKTLAREVSAHLNDAYETLSDKSKCAEYLFLLADDRIKGDARKAELIRDAETKSKMGLVMLKKRDYQKAREFFKNACESDPSTGSHRALLAWAVFSDPDFDKEKGLEKAYALIVEALAAKTVDAKTHFVAGQIMKARGEMQEAEHQFRATVKLDENHTDALRELRLLEMRAEKKAQRRDSEAKGSALSKLFKRD